MNNVFWRHAMYTAYRSQTTERVSESEGKMLEHGFVPASWYLSEGWGE